MMIPITIWYDLESVAMISKTTKFNITIIKSSNRTYVNSNLYLSNFETIYAKFWLDL